jgi:hypothetical protein
MNGVVSTCRHSVTSATYGPGVTTVKCDVCGKTGTGANRALAEYNMRYAPPTPTVEKLQS